MFVFFGVKSRNNTLQRTDFPGFSKSIRVSKAKTLSLLRKSGSLLPNNVFTLRSLIPLLQNYLQFCVYIYMKGLFSIYDSLDVEEFGVRTRMYYLHI